MSPTTTIGSLIWSTSHYAGLSYENWGMFPTITIGSLWSTLRRWRWYCPTNLAPNERNTIVLFLRGTSDFSGEYIFRCANISSKTPLVGLKEFCLTSKLKAIVLSFPTSLDTISWDNNFHRNHCHRQKEISIMIIAIIKKMTWQHTGLYLWRWRSKRWSLSMLVIIWLYGHYMITC